MRAWIALLVLLILLVLALVGYNSGWFGHPAGAPAPAAPIAPVSPPPSAPGEPVGEGGAEQLPDEDPIPPAPPEPVQPPEPPAPITTSFEHNPAGALLPGTGSGYLDRTVWAPQLCFPFEEAAYPNSQVYGPGGGMGPAGKPSQCDPSNYSLPWRDNFCESRGYVTPLCASGKGHQGQDIRPASCKKNVHWVIAAEDGIITDITSYTVTLTASAPPHRTYRYLHMRMSELAVAEGKVVKRGDRLGRASNDFGGTPTTIHMHFEIRAGVTGLSTDGKPVKVLTFLPPYLSLVKAYERKLGGEVCKTAP